MAVWRLRAVRIIIEPLGLFSAQLFVHVGWSYRSDHYYIWKATLTTNEQETLWHIHNRPLYSQCCFVLLPFPNFLGPCADLAVCIGHGCPIGQQC